MGDPAFDPDRFAWTVTQNGNALSGPAVLTLVGGQGQGRNVNGTMAGTLSGTQLSLVLTLPAGSFTAVGGPSGCSVTGTASTTPTSTSMTTTMTRTFDPSCIPTVSRSSTDTVQLSLNKQ